MSVLYRLYVWMESVGNQVESMLIECVKIW